MRECKYFQFVGITGILKLFFLPRKPSRPPSTTAQVKELSEAAISLLLCKWATHCEHNTEHIYQDMELRTQVFGHNGSRIRFHDYIQSHMLSQIYILSQSIAAAGGNSHLHSPIWQSHPHPGSCDWCPPIHPQSMRSCPHDT